MVKEGLVEFSRKSEAWKFLKVVGDVSCVNGKALA